MGSAVETRKVRVTTKSGGQYLLSPLEVVERVNAEGPPSSRAIDLKLKDWWPESTAEDTKAGSLRLSEIVRIELVGDLTGGATIPLNLNDEQRLIVRQAVIQVDPTDPAASLATICLNYQRLVKACGLAADVMLRTDPLTRPAGTAAATHDEWAQALAQLLAATGAPAPTSTKPAPAPPQPAAASAPAVVNPNPEASG